MQFHDRVRCRRLHFRGLPRPIFVLKVVLFITVAFQWGGATEGQEESLVQDASSLSGLSSSQIYEIEDDVSLDLDNELLRRLLYRIKRVSAKNLNRYLAYSESVSVQAVRENPRRYRGWIREVSGNVVNLETHRFENSTEDALKGCFVVDLEDGAGNRSRVIATSIPRAWSDGHWKGQPGKGVGYFFQFGEIEAGKMTVPLMVVNRMEWYPSQPLKEAGITGTHVDLAEAGFDIGQLDLVRKEHARPLGAADSEAFFQMLKASTLAGPNPKEGAADFVSLVKDWKSNVGNRVRVRGRVRRVVPLPIDSQDIVERFGVKRYFELDTFVQLGAERIVINRDSQQELVYEDRFPLTVCFVGSDDVDPRSFENTMVDIEGYFFRFWKFENDFSGDAGQIAPLVMATAVTTVPNKAGLLDQTLMYFLVLVLLGIGALVYFLRDRPGLQKNRHSVKPEQLDLSGFDD